MCIFFEVTWAFGKMWFKLDAIGNFTEAGLPTDDIFGLQQELRLPDFVDDGVEVESLTGTLTCLKKNKA